MRTRGVPSKLLIVAFAASILWLAPPARAAACNVSGNQLNIDIGPGESVNVRINSSNTILVSGGGLTDSACGGNNANTIAVIDVDGAGGNETFTINMWGGGGPFDDDDDFTIDLGGGSDSLVINGRSGIDTITFSPFEANGADITQAGVESFSVFAGGGADVVNGGTFGIGLTLGGGGGADTVTGGNGGDTINGGGDTSNDTLNGGAGTDTLT
jgi:Ca2+-binding RTX toxin-like protein